MANSTLFKTLPKFGHVGAAIARRSTTSNPTMLLASNNPRSIQISSQQEGSAAKYDINQGAIEVIIPGENMEHNAFSTAEQVGQKTKDGAGMASAWDSTKDMTAQRARDSVLENAEECSEEYVKANAESVKKSMNTKNCI